MRSTLKRVAHPSGNNLKNPSKKQKQKGKTKGDQMQLTCFVCKRYKKIYSYISTATCAHCGTAVCMKIDRSNEHPDRVGTCLHEHLNTGN
jgi:ribosomal protein S27E